MDNPSPETLIRIRVNLCRITTISGGDMTNLPLVPIPINDRSARNRSSKTNHWSSSIGQMSEPMPNTRLGRQDGAAWSMPFSISKLSQPQDGLMDRRRRLAMLSSPAQTNLLNEPEDARMTGGTRSLSRRLLGLNILSKRRTPEILPGTRSRPEPA